MQARRCFDAFGLLEGTGYWQLSGGQPSGRVDDWVALHLPSPTGGGDEAKQR